MPSNRPTKEELLEAVIEFLEKRVMPELDKHTAFHTRVAANVLNIVRRELEQGPGLDAAERDRLKDLLGKDGTLEGLFSNGETSPLGQVVLSNFTSPQGLVRVGDNLYARTTQSGEPTVGAAATGGRGRIQGNAIEMSNVDVAEEFIKLIIYQRGYQANARVITTSDQITLETIQLKQ